MADTPERLHAFQMGLAFADSQIPLIGYYDFGQLITEGDRPVLVDIGGGSGHSITQILKAHPELPAAKIVLEDLDEPIEIAKTSATLPKDVQKLVHDFWTPQPVKGKDQTGGIETRLMISGAKAYLIRRTLHDYSDDNCITILKHTREAMASDSILLIGDLVLADRATPADIIPSTFGVTMMNMAGKERMLSGFEKILAASALKLEKVYSQGLGYIIEAHPV
jgi:hypothetical protein